MITKFTQMNAQKFLDLLYRELPAKTPGTTNPCLELRQMLNPTAILRYGQTHKLVKVLRELSPDAAGYDNMMFSMARFINSCN